MFGDIISEYEWVGIEEKQPVSYALQAGRLHMGFVDGRIVNVSVEGEPLLEEVYVALRDANWDTIPYSIEDLAISQEEESFRISFTAVHSQGEIRYCWEGNITGNADSVITYGFRGVAQSDFPANRIGFCVLHPASCGGVPCTIGHVTGEAEASVFPKAIAPHQPFQDIRSITHQPYPGLTLGVAFAGEVFEMEDQRNWTDASFKTYCRPLSLPFPVAIHKGDVAEQTVTIRLDSHSNRQAAPEQQKPLFTGSKEKHCFSLGSSIVRPLTENQLLRVKELKLSHLRYDHHFDGSLQTLEEVTAQVHQLGLKLWLSVFFTADWKAQSKTLQVFLETHQDHILMLSLFQEGIPVMASEMLVAIKQQLSNVPFPIGSGTDAFFAQLNREPLPQESMAFVSYSATPQVHAFDNDSIMSTVHGQADTLLSGAKLYPGLPLWISPVSLKVRWNPAAELPSPSDADPRQMSLFAASWFLRSVAACICHGAAGATYFTLTGSNGIMEEEAPPKLHSFPSKPDMLFPLYYAFHALRGIQEMAATVTITPILTSIRLQDGSHTRLILANPTQHPTTVPLPDTPPTARTFLLDADTAPTLCLPPHRWTTHPPATSVTLKPYALFIAEF